MGDVAKGLCLMRSAGGWASISVGGLVLRRGGVMVLKIDGVCISNRRKKGGSSSVSSSQCSRVSRRGLGIREKREKDDVNWRRRRRSRKSVKRERVRVGKLPKVQKRKSAGSAIERAREEKGKGEEKMQ